MKNRITRKFLSLMLILTMVMPLIGCTANSSQAGTNEAQAGDAAHGRACPSGRR